MAGAIDILWTFWSQERRLEKRFTPKKVQNLLTKEPQLRTHPVNITESHHLGLPSHHQCPGCENDNTAPTAKVQCLQKLPQKKGQHKITSLLWKDTSYKNDISKPVAEEIDSCTPWCRKHVLFHARFCWSNPCLNATTHGFKQTANLEDVCNLQQKKSLEAIEFHVSCHVSTRLESYTNLKHSWFFPCLRCWRLKCSLILRVHEIQGILEKRLGDRLGWLFFAGTGSP